MTPPPRPWPGCWPPTAASPCCQPRRRRVRPDGRPLQPDRRPQPRRLPQRPRRRPAQGRPPRPPTRIRRAALSDHRPHRPARGPARAGRPARVRRPRAAGPVPLQPPRRAWSAAASPAPHPSPKRWPTATPWSSKPWPPASTTPAGDDPTVLTLDPQAGELLLGFERDLEPRLAADSGDLAHLAGWAAKLAGATCRLAALLHLASHLRDGWAQPISADTFAGAIRLADYLVEHARAVFDLMGADPRIDDARWLLDWISRTNQRPVQPPRRPPGRPPRPLPQGHRPRASPAAAGGARLPPPRRPRTLPGPARPWPTRLAAVPGQPSATRHRNHRNHKNTRRTRFCGFCGFCGAWQESPMRGARLAVTESGGAARAASPDPLPAVTLSNENGPSRSRPCLHPPPAASGGHEPAISRR